LIAAGVIPPPVYEKKCDTCSLFDLCQPKLPVSGDYVTRYLEGI
jgi:CRISPR-associated exonuclease Cas4